MPNRSVLVVHESVTLRRIMQRQILSELTDVDVQESPSAADAVVLLDKEPFQLVICGNEIGGMNGVTIYERMAKSGHNRSTPFLLLTSSPTPENLARFNQRGITNVLAVPCKAKDLAGRINALCDPRQWRRHDRIHIPDTSVIIRTDEMCLEGEVLNISRGGLLATLPCPRAVTLLLGPAELDVQFPDECGGAELRSEAIFLRLDVAEWESDTQPKTIRVAWRFRNLPEEEQTLLGEIIDRARDTMHLDEYDPDDEPI